MSKADLTAPSPALVKLMNTPDVKSVGYYIFLVGKCFLLLGMCAYAAKVYYDLKKRQTPTSMLFCLYFLTTCIMIVYELVFHQIMTIYYCILFASLGQVIGIRINLNRVAKYHTEERKGCLKNTFRIFWVIYGVSFIGGVLPFIGGYCTDFRIYPPCFQIMFAL